MSDREELPLEELHRLVRDSDVHVWKRACTELGIRARSQPAAYDELRALIQCPYRELRLRGVAALAELAPVRPDDTCHFMQESLRENEGSLDPVFTDALYGLLTRLPTAHARRMLDSALADSRETVRGAVAASLGNWKGWATPVLLRLARDPSPFVRSSLAVALPRLRDLSEAAQAIELLEQSPEDYVRQFVTEELGARPKAEVRVMAETEACPLGEGEADDLWSGEVIAIEDTEDGTGGQVEEDALDDLAPLLGKPDCPVTIVTRIQEAFRANPNRMMDVLAPLLDCPGTLSLLDQVACLAPEPRVSLLARALFRLLSPGQETAEGRLRDLRSALEGQQGADAQAFQRKVRECHDACRARSLEDVRAWARRVDVRVYANVLETLEPLDTEDGLVALQEVVKSLEEARGRIDREEEIPTRNLLRVVVESWGEVLDQEIQGKLSEVEP